MAAYIEYFFRLKLFFLPACICSEEYQDSLHVLYDCTAFDVCSELLIKLSPVLLIHDVCWAGDPTLME